MIQGLCDRQADSITDVKLGDADTDSYKYDPMAALLARWETIKKDKPGKHCHNQQNFSVCYFFQRHNRDGSPGCTRAIESNHGSKNGQPHFARTGADKGSNRNRGCKIVFTYDLWISTVLIKDPISFHLYYQLNNHQSNIRFYMSCVK